MLPAFPPVRTNKRAYKAPRGAAAVSEYRTNEPAIVSGGPFALEIHLPRCPYQATAKLGVPQDPDPFREQENAYCRPAQMTGDNGSASRAGWLSDVRVAADPVSRIDGCPPHSVLVSTVAEMGCAPVCPR